MLHFLCHLTTKYEAKRNFQAQISGDQMENSSEGIYQDATRIKMLESIKINRKAFRFFAAVCRFLGYRQRWRRSSITQAAGERTIVCYFYQIYNRTQINFVVMKHDGDAETKPKIFNAILCSRPHIAVESRIITDSLFYSIFFSRCSPLGWKGKEIAKYFKNVVFSCWRFWSRSRNASQPISFPWFFFLFMHNGTVFNHD